MDALSNDELLEVTPESLRVRKRELHHGLRYRAEKNARKEG